jgi:uncharacterized protein (TIGR03067 family)
MESLLTSPDLAKEAARRDQERLQGAWAFVSGRRQAQLLIAGGRYTIRFHNGDIYMGSFALDPTHKPRAMDLVIEEGPERFRGKTALAIYEFDGDHLIWCPTEPGRAQRLRAFPPADDLDHLCLVFRRDRPRR